METTHNSNGMAIAPFLGYSRNFLGSGYNCPALKLHGFRTERQLNNAITKAHAKRQDVSAVSALASIHARRF